MPNRFFDKYNTHEYRKHLETAAILVTGSAKSGGSSSVVADLTDRQVGWRRSKNIYLGDKIGSLRLYPSENGYKVDDLVRAFYEWLGFSLTEYIKGVKTWGGMIYSMDLSISGDVRRRTLEYMTNAVKATYINELDEYAETGWYTDADSIAQYGRKETIIQMNGYPQAAAESKAQAILKFNKDVTPRLVSIGATDETYLEIKAMGFAVTANWRYVTAQDGLTGNADVWVKNILDTDCPFLTAGSIKTNAVQVKRENQIIRRALDTLTYIAELGGTSYEPWQIYIDQNRRLSYIPINLGPQMYWSKKGLNTALTFRSHEDVNPFILQPGVVRNLDYPVRRAERGEPLLEDARDALIEEIEVSWDGTVYLRNEDTEDTAILAAQMEYEKMLNDLAEKEESDK